MVKIKHIFLYPLQKFPFITFYILLGTLVALIILGQFITKPSSITQATSPSPRTVNTFKLQDPISITLPAQVNNQRLITINSQTQGLITKINIVEGQKIKRGQTLVSIGTTNLGGNPATAGRQIAQTNLKFQKDNQSLQSDILNLQRRLSDQNKDLANDNRDLTNQSLSDTQKLFNDSQTIYNQVNDQLNLLLADPTTASSAASLQQTKLSLQANLNQLSQAIRVSQLQADENKPPAQIANTSRELTQKQLDLQAKSQDLNLTLTKLNLELARINEALFYPASPINGTVQLVHVNPNQPISPGMPIATIIDAHESPLKITTSIPSSIYPYIDSSSTITFNHQDSQLNLNLIYLSLIPDSNNLHPAILTTTQVVSNPLPSDITINFTLKSDQFIIPIDSIYQSSNDSYVYILKETDQGFLTTKHPITTSKIIGNYIITSGLNEDDTIITSRYVTDQSLVIPNN